MKNILDIVDKKKLDVVSETIEKAHGLPNECYLDGPYTQIERKKLFEDKWVVVGVASSLPNPGDAKPFDLLGIPLIILRDKEKKIRVFHNVCSHRGYKLLKEPCKLKNILRCPYHSWSYDYNGDLVATPHLGGMNKHENKDFDKSKSGLKEVHSSVWLDLIMVNISNNEVSFEEYIKPLEDRWSEFWTKEDQKLIHHAGDYGYFLLEAKCNWKFAIENYCESYHLPWVHPGLNAYSKIDDHYHIQGLPNRFAGQGTVVYNPKFEGNDNLPTFPGWSKEKELCAEYVALFPNVMLGIHRDHYYAYWLEPVNHAYTKEHMEIYYVGKNAAKSKEYKSLRKQNYKQWHSIQSEDLNIIQGMQEGRKSPIYNGGNFSPVMDNPTHHFNKWVAQNLLD
ncbi:aromatic ring-hydroxylating dioxygenase subunit alpha [Alphaproteobacteria bacterium]|nr:aromatic ring-hydroxylating dioxygenase subunit alpha [Alphaproteobacteria bacterium]